MYRIIFLLFLAYCLPVRPEEAMLCCNYNCATHATVTFSERQVPGAAELFVEMRDVASACEAIAHINEWLKGAQPDG